MSPLLWRSSRRTLTRHPWQSVLSVLGVALGVAVVVAIDLANTSARRAFTLSTEAVTGKTTHQVVGGPEGLPEELYREVVLAVPGVPAAPVVEGYVGLARAPGRAFLLLGVDPFAEGPLRPYLAGGAGGGFDLGPFLTEPGAVVLSGEAAERMGLAPGDALDLSVAGRNLQGRLVGTLSPGDAGSREALSDLLVADVATAQELLGQVGTLSRVDLVLPRGEDGEALEAAVREVLPRGAAVLPAASRARTVDEMTRAFRFNLTALSLLALICGAFLIYNTMTFSVVRRRELIGALRALGVTRREVFTLILAEAALIGALGTLAGAALGTALARGLLRLVARTINDLYFTLNVTGLDVNPRSLAVGAALGLGATLLAALAPAREATAAPPRAVLRRSDLEARRRAGVPRAAAAGLGLAAFGALLLLPGGSLPLSFAGLFAIVVGCALLSPAATVLLAGLARRPLGAAFGILGRMAAGGVTAALSRTAVAIAALAIAVSVTVGVGVMIGSFRTTVERWLGGTLRADLYVSIPGPQRAGGPGRRIPEELVAEVRSLPGVERVNTLVAFTVEGAGGLTQVRAFDLDSRGRASLRFKEGDPEEAWPAFETGGAAIVSEPYAFRRGVGVGSSVRLRTDRGKRELPVVGVYYDYGSEQGAVVVSRRTFEALWDARGFTALAVFGAPGAALEAVQESVRDLAAAHGQELLVRSSRALREVSLSIFDRTFLITQVLRLLAGVVAFIAVLSALMALQLERGRELGVLRANGMTPRQVWQLVTAETGLMGLIAGLLAAPMGLLLAAVMVFVINRRSFGWSLELQVPPEVLLQAVALALGASLLAGLYPAYRMARSSPALALREE